MRFSLQAPVLFSWKVAGQQQQRAGFTRDVSKNGTFITCEVACEVEIGTELTIELLLPALAGSSGPARLEGKGVVFRRSGSNEQPGFVLRSEFGLDCRAA